MTRSLYSPLRRTSYILAALLIPAIAPAQAVPDTVAQLARLDAQLVALTAQLRAVWPGYQYDAVGLLYVVPGKAKLAARWPVAPPAGMQALSGHERLHWTGTQGISWAPGLAVATGTVQPGMNEVQLMGLALHEAFHAYEVTARREGRKFGWGENAMVTARYPVFDLDNEALFAVEARLLGSAVRTASASEARRLAGEFLQLRKQRHARLDSVVVNFERAAELHEGLAQYALLRGLTRVARAHPKHGAQVQAEYETETKVLEQTLRSGTSVRRRFYATGSHLGLLLDRLAPADWKEQLLRDDLWLEEILAQSVTQKLVSRAVTARLTELTGEAARAIDRLRRQRGAMRDSLLALPGLRLALNPAALPGGRLDWCNFDPQNLLPTGSGQNLHTRMLSVCSQGRTVAQFEQPAVEDELSGIIRTVVDAGAIQISSAGAPIALPAIGASLNLRDFKLVAGRVTSTLPAVVLVRGARELLLIPVQ